MAGLKTSKSVFKPTPGGRKEFYLSLMARAASGQKIDKRMPLPPPLTADDKYIYEITKGMIHKGFCQPVDDNKLEPIVNTVLEQMAAEGKIDGLTPEQKEDLANVDNYFKVSKDTTGKMTAVKVGDVTLAVDKTTGKVLINGESPVLEPADDVDFDDWFD